MSGRRMFKEVTSTWNPIVGCEHDCSYCYARKLAKTRLKHLPQYKDFKPKLVEHKLKECPEKGVVFVCDMGDFFSPGVKAEWQYEVFNAIRAKKRPNLTLYFLTKNPIGYLDWLSVGMFEALESFVDKVALGVTIETDTGYRQNFQSKAPHPQARLYVAKYLRKKWNGQLFVSIEPIVDFSSKFVEQIVEIQPDWVYVGYDNYNCKLPEPPLQKTQWLIESLEREGIEVRTKTLRKAWFEEE